MYWLLVPIAVLAASIYGLMGGEHAPSPGLSLRNDQITFQDDFKKLSVSPWGPGAPWIAHTPWNGDFGDAAFANPENGFPFKTSDAGLRIEARKGIDGKWKSGLLSSTDPSGRGFSQQYGLFEMRAKLPPGPGLWPGFWLIGNKAPGGSAELDILEYLGHDPSKYEATIHVWPRNGAGRNFQQKFVIRVPPGSLTQGYHVYGASVDEDIIRFYLDKVQVAEAPTPPEFRQKLFVLLNLAMGSGYPIDKTPNPSFMDVSYVRVYSKH